MRPHWFIALATFFIAAWSAVAASDQALRPPQPPTQTPESYAGWDKEAAARYLDDRIDLWFTKGKHLQTGDAKTVCVSCHTVVPYSLARPALRRAMRVTEPTAQEKLLLGETIRRVETYDSHEPLYLGKKEESRGTEAVLNLLILSGDDTRQGRIEPSDPTRKALIEVWKEQRPDGAWNWLDFGNEPYESSDSVFYGATLAAIAIGTVPAYADNVPESQLEHITTLRAYLNAHYSAENLYNQTWMMLASTRLKGLLQRDQQGALIAELKRRQNPDGGWSLHSLGPWTWSKSRAPFAPEGKPDMSVLARSDGYATGLITYTLREGGLPGTHPVVKSAIAWLKQNQHKSQIDQNCWNCWRTYSLNYDREHGGDEGEPWRRMFMSDAATAFAVLALLSSP